ncbi:MAG: glycosyltransferase family 9 protein, partial [Elusimicrobiota bacterium]
SKDGPAVHAVERGLALARKIGADVSKPGYDLRVIAEDNEWVTCVLNKKGVKPGQKNIGIILGAGVPQKQWAVNKIVETAKVLIQKYNVILLGDKNQAGNEQVLLRECPEVVSTVGLTGLTQFAAVLSRCNVVIGSDTAAVHIAMGYNIPTIGLYGPSNPLKTGLYGDGKKSVIYNKMKCSPCGIRPNCKNNVCMDKISPGEVVEEVEKMFAGVLK